MAAVKKKVQPLKENYAAVEIVRLKLDQLKPAEYNARTITQEALSGLSSSMEQFGLLAFPVVNKRLEGYRVVGGHKRIELLKQRGDTEVECVVVKFDDKQEQQANFALNNRAIQGTFVPELTKALLEQIKDALAQQGHEPQDAFSELRFDALVKYINKNTKHVLGVDDVQVEGQIDEDDEPGVARTKPFSKSGVFYQLGKHVLYCGKLEGKGSLTGFGIENADAAFTFIAHNQNISAAYVDTYLAHVLANTNGPIYVATNFSVLALLQGRFESLGGHWSSTLVWFSPDAKPNDESYREISIPVLYGWRETAPHSFFGGREQGNVFKLRRSQKAELPVELIVKCLLNSTMAGMFVLDVDVRRGASVIACEKTGRRLVGYANSPREADATRQRWAQFVHGKSVNWSSATPERKQ